MPPNVVEFPFGADNRELYHSAQESLDLISGHRIYTRIFRVGWAARHDFVDTYLGLREENGSWSLGNPYPEDQDAFPISVEIVGTNKVRDVDRGDHGLFIAYDFAIITVKYAYYLYPELLTGIDPNKKSYFKYVTEDFTTEVELLELTDKKVKLKTELGVEIDSEVQHKIYLHLMRYTITAPIHTVTTVATEAFDVPIYDFNFNVQSTDEDVLFNQISASKYSGYVNNSEMITFSGLTFPAHTLRFDGLTSQTNQQVPDREPGKIDTFFTYSTVLTFIHNPLTWLKRWDVNTNGELELMTIDPPLVPGAIDFEDFFEGIFA